MKLVKYLLPLLALPFLSSLSCGKKPPPRPVHYMTEEFKDYVVFPEGSWWVYENQFGQKDTHHLYAQGIEIVDGTNRVEHDYEWMTQHLSTSYYSGTLYGCGGNQLGYGDIYREGYMGPSTSDVLQFFSDSEVGDSACVTICLKYIDQQDSLLIKDKYYSDVKVFGNSKIYYQRQPTKIFYSRHVGVIRKELYDGTRWELIQHFINN